MPAPRLVRFVQIASAVCVGWPVCPRVNGPPRQRRIRRYPRARLFAIRFAFLNRHARPTSQFPETHHDPIVDARIFRNPVLLVVRVPGAATPGLVQTRGACPPTFTKTGSSQSSATIGCEQDAPSWSTVWFIFSALFSRGAGLGFGTDLSQVYRRFSFQPFYRFGCSDRRPGLSRQRNLLDALVMAGPC